MTGSRTLSTAPSAICQFSWHQAATTALIALLAVLTAASTFAQAPDVDGDGVPNDLELNGYYYNSSTGLESCNPETDFPCYRTDYQQWSTDGDPFSDFDEVSGANMPVDAPFNHPYVAAQHIIAVDLVGYDVTPRATITDAQGGSLSNAYQNSTTSTYEESIEVTATAAVGPAGLAGYSASGSVTETTANTTSTTRTSTVDWNTATTVDVNEAADLALAVHIRNAGSAQARDVRLFFNLKIGSKVVASIRTPVVTGLLDAGSIYPSLGQGPWIIDSSEDAGGSTHPITLNMEQLKAIEQGAPLTLVVTEVQADILRWNPAGGGSWSCDANISCDWASFESRIRDQTINLNLHLGTDRRQYRVFGGKDYSNPADPDLTLTLRDVLDLIANVSGPNESASIEGRPYPSSWYAMTSSDELVTDWENAGSPGNLLPLVMRSGVDLRLSTPSGDPRPIIDMATYSPDMRRVYVSARAGAGGAFPLAEVTANITVNGDERVVTLTPGEAGFYTNEEPFATPASGGGEATVRNNRGDVITRGLQLPVSQSATCNDIEAAYALVSDGEYLLFKDGDLNKPARAYCKFFVSAPPTTHFWIDRTPEWSNERNIFLGGVAFVGEQTAFAVGNARNPGGGSSRPMILRTLDGGATWDSVTVRQIGTDPSLNSVDFNDDASVGIAVGFDYDNDSKGYAMYRTTNGGSTWIGPGNFDVLSSFPSFDEIRHAGGSTWFVGGGARFMRSNDNGITWQAVESGGLWPTDPNVSDIEFKDASNGLIIAGRSQQINAIFATSDGGENWDVRKEFDSEFWLNKIVHITGTTWIGGRGSNNPYTAELFRSDDDGATWTSIIDLATLGSGRLTDLEFTSATRGYVLDRIYDVSEDTYYGQVWRTDDGGSTWTSERLMNGGDPNGLGMYDANRGIVAASGGVLITTSGGGSPVFVTGVEDEDGCRDGHGGGGGGTGCGTSNLPESTSISLSQNYPNPVRGITTLAFSINESTPVTLEVYDILGRRVETLLANEWRSAGEHTVNFNATTLAAGGYFYRLRAGKQAITRQMVVLR